VPKVMRGVMLQFEHILKVVQPQ